MALLHKPTGLYLAPLDETGLLGPCVPWPPLGEYEVLVMPLFFANPNVRLADLQKRYEFDVNLTEENLRLVPIDISICTN